MNEQITEPTDLEGTLACECGYDLRGLPAGGDCPECGTPIQKARLRKTSAIEQELEPHGTMHTLAISYASIILVVTWLPFVPYIGISAMLLAVFGSGFRMIASRHLDQAMKTSGLRDVLLLSILELILGIGTLVIWILDTFMDMSLVLSPLLMCWVFLMMASAIVGSLSIRTLARSVHMTVLMRSLLFGRSCVGIGAILYIIAVSIKALPFQGTPLLLVAFIAAAILSGLLNTTGCCLLVNAVLQVATKIPMPRPSRPSLANQPRIPLHENPPIDEPIELAEPPEKPWEGPGDGESSRQ
ncbi:MAG: hypothetical protein CMJ32_12135 [Phycisphaerae bacterium]|nr:hypothetical protein [Phycisphaerae bacterium]